MKEITWKKREYEEGHPMAFQKAEVAMVGDQMIGAIIWDKGFMGRHWGWSMLLPRSGLKALERNFEASAAQARAAVRTRYLRFLDKSGLIDPRRAVSKLSFQYRNATFPEWTDHQFPDDVSFKPEGLDPRIQAHCWLQAQIETWTPGTEFRVVETLVFTDVRPIISNGPAGAPITGKRKIGMIEVAH